MAKTRKRLTREQRITAENIRRTSAKSRKVKESLTRGDVKSRVAAYLALNKKDRSKYYPKNAEYEFWREYDRGSGD